MKVTRISEMRKLDTTAIENYGIKAELLMENAGQAVYNVILNQLGVKGRRFLICCGLGNNGGDGLVVARKLHSMGGLVKVLIFGDPNKLRGAAKTNFNIVTRLGLETQQLRNIEAVEAELFSCEAVVDAILGTGISRNISGRYREAIEAINQSGKPVFSVDIPSGVHGDTGQVMGIAIRADHTVTFGLPKIGNLLPPGSDLGGRLWVSHISFPPSLTHTDSLKIETNCPIYPSTERQKRDLEPTGKTLIIMGQAHKTRALHLLIRSFYQVEGRVLSLAAPQSLAPFTTTGYQKVAFFAQKETRMGRLALDSKATLLKLAQQTQNVVLRSCESTEPETQQLFRALITEIDRPLVIVCPGLITSHKDLEMARKRKQATILTLRLRDLAEIAETKDLEIRADRISALQQLCRDYNTTVVLQGERSLIGYSDERVFIDTHVDPSVLIKGSSDILTGILAAMIESGLSPQDAIRQSVYLTGLSTYFAVTDQKNDKEKITASNILSDLPLALERVREASAGKSAFVEAGIDLI